MRAILIAAGILSFVGAAFAQTTLQPFDGQSPAAQAHKPPPGIPGFLDPTTGKFAPLADGQPKSFPRIGVAITTTYSWNFYGLHKTDTVLCVLTATFGNLVNGAFFPNHTTSFSWNFAVGDPETRVTVVDDYTPTSSQPKVQLQLQCQVSDENAQLDEQTITTPVQTLESNGEVDKIFDVDL